MTIDNDIKNQYFSFLINLVLPNDVERNNYINLLKTLYFRNYIPSIERDKNRVADAYALRSMFLDAFGFPPVYKNDLNESVSMLEIMAALANRIENNIMYDPDYGNRIDVWFKEMLFSLGLLDCTDYNFDEVWVNSRIDAFLNREYEVNGKGSLFTISDPSIDMRDLEIWYQMQLYVSEYDRNNR